MSTFTIPGDVALTEFDHDVGLWQGADEIADRCNLALKTFQGSWSFDTRLGLRNFETLFEKPAALELWRAEVWRVVQSIQGISYVQQVQITYDRSNRAFLLEWAAKSDAGVIAGIARIT